MTTRISNLLSRIVVVSILLPACLDTVCNGLFSKFRGRKYELLSNSFSSSSNDANNKLNDLMEQCRKAHFVPESSPLWWTRRCQQSSRQQVPSSRKYLHPEFLHYFARHVRNNMTGGVEGDDFRIFCEDAANAGFPGLKSAVVQRLQPEDYTVVSDFFALDNNRFLSLLAAFRNFGRANPDLPIHDRNGTPQQGFREWLTTQGARLLQKDRAKTQRLLDDGVEAGYEADVNHLKEYLKENFPELTTSFSTT